MMTPTPACTHIQHILSEPSIAYLDGDPIPEPGILHCYCHLSFPSFPKAVPYPELPLVTVHYSMHFCLTPCCWAIPCLVQLLTFQNIIVLLLHVAGIL